MLRSYYDKKSSHNQDVTIGNDFDVSQYGGSNPEAGKKKINLNNYDNDLTNKMGHSNTTSLQTTLHKIDAMHDAITRDKNDRATVDLVLDPRTLIIIHKLI